MSIKAFINLFRKGYRLRNPEGLKNATVWLGFLTAVAGVLVEYDVNIPWLTPELLNQSASVLAAVFGVFVASSTVVTTDKIGLPGLKPAPTSEKMVDEKSEPIDLPPIPQYSKKAKQLAQFLKNENVNAFLRMIRYAEGTDGLNGYRMEFGGSLFSDLSDKPRNIIEKGGYRSSAKGAYQIINRTWDDIQRHLNLPDFSPYSQDIAAVFLINREHQLKNVVQGNIEAAIKGVSSTWASLPGNNYGQPQKDLDKLVNLFNTTRA